MSYKHILVAVDLSPDSRLVVDKAVSLAKSVSADLSFIHVDASYNELRRVGGGFIDINVAESFEHAEHESQTQLQSLANESDYPVKHCLVGSGELEHELKNAIVKHKVDLVICGHHQDFWSMLLSSTKQLINNVPVDLLVVPLKED
jgi:universal stress protein A